SLAQKRTIAIPSMFGPVFGFIGGVFSGLFSTGGPLYVAYIHNRLSGSDVIRATIIATMGITDVLRVPLLAMSGIITYHTLVVFLYALPVFLLALLIGHGTYRSINEHTFRTIVLVLLSISGITLLIG
ncbi:MAG: sulfite exporter TauE/SafE family protein, partial [Candidatus Woesearchaeota archaeon]